MHKLDLLGELKEANAIENRKIREDQRKSRIFNSKLRQIGIDVSALNLQIEEKKHQEKLKDEADNLYAASLTRADKIAVLMNKRQQEDLKEINKTINEFRFLHQRLDQRREFDLYDPDSLKKDRPARIGDDDPRCKTSSIQKFDGEDLNYKTRLSNQRDQMRSWLENQINDKSVALNSFKQSEKLYDFKRLELDKRVCDLMNAEDECKRAMNVAISNYNEALSLENTEKRRLKLQQESDDNKTHIINSLTSDLLTENPNQSNSAFGPNRILPDRYKGMSKEELKRICDFQKKQVLEKEFRVKQEKELDSLANKQSVAYARSALLIEKEIMRQKTLRDKKVAEDNLKSSKCHNQMMDYFNNEIYTNQPTAEYFMQFNTCSR